MMIGRHRGQGVRSSLRVRRGFVALVVGASLYPSPAHAADHVKALPDAPNPEAPLTERYKGLRYLEDYAYLAGQPSRDFWDPVKYVSLWPGGAVSLGGQLRTRYELVEPYDFGLEPSAARSVLLVRGLAHADLRVLPELRLFAQLGSFAALGLSQRAAPPDADRLDVTQLFVESDIAAGELRLAMRVGRQEMPLGSTKWVGVRDGANVRQAFDLARVTFTVPVAQLEVFGGGVPKLERGSFDDEPDFKNQFWGAYGTSEVVGKQVAVDAFYLGRKRPQVSYIEAQGREARHTLGLRLFGELPSGFRYVGHALLQLGTLDDRSISAWGFATGLWQRLPSPLDEVELGLRGDALSGDQRVGDGKVGTFHPLFPNQSFFSNFTAIFPSNIYDLHPLVRVEHGPVGLEAGAVFFWRQSLRDSIFTSPGVVAFDATGSRARFVGTQAVVAAKYQANPHLVLNAEYSRLFAGPVITRGGGRSADFLGCWTSYTF
jgi:hypothetical protein